MGELCSRKIQVRLCFNPIPSLSTLPFYICKFCEIFFLAEVKLCSSAHFERIISFNILSTFSILHALAILGQYTSVSTTKHECGLCYSDLVMSVKYGC